VRALEAAGEPLSEDLDGKRKVWRIEASARHDAVTLTASQMLALLLSRRVFDFHAGTGFKEDLDEVFNRVEVTLKRSDFVAARNLDRKVVDVNEAPHVYEGRSDDVNDIMTALLREERLRVRHASVDRGRKRFKVDPTRCSSTRRACISSDGVITMTLFGRSPSTAFGPRPG
jgi:hypothetical protein